MSAETRHLDHTGPLVTLQTHVLQEQAKIPGATGMLSWVLSSLSISTKIIANQVRHARLHDVLGEAGADNVQGEQQQKLDVISNAVLLRVLSGREGVAIVASEENEEPVIIRSEETTEHRYCVLFDPLDGSSNLDVCGGVGTIFSILRHNPHAADVWDLLQMNRGNSSGNQVSFIKKFVLRRVRYYSKAMRRAAAAKSSFIRG